MKTNEIEELTEFLSLKHHEATLLLTGSFARGTQTEYSDFDILSIQSTGLEPFRKAYQFHTRLVEVFCHTEESILNWISENTRNRKKSMASMLCDSQLLVGDSRLLSRLKEYSEEVVLSGPPNFSPEQDWNERKNITEKLDDLLGIKSPNEITILGTELFISVLNYFLVKSKLWLTTGKYYRSALLGLGQEDIELFSRAIDNLVNSCSSTHLVELTEDILNRFGGRAYEYQEY